MALLVRITDFVPSTLIKSQEVDDELNQLVNLLSGVSTTKDTLLKFSDGTNPVLRVDQLGAGLIQQWLNNGTSRASLSALGKWLLPAGIGSTPSTDQISNLGVYFVDPTIRATGADTNETDFSSKTLSANVLANDGDFLIFLTAINFAANANNKTWKLYFAGTAIAASGPAAFNGVDQIIWGFAYRRTSAIISGVAGVLTSAAGLGTGLARFDVAGQDFTTTNIFKSTGQNAVASANDIRQFGFIVLKGSV